MNNDLIRKNVLIDYIESDASGLMSAREYQRDYIECIEEQPIVRAVPIDELIEFRDFVYAADGITMRHLKMLNKLIAKYDGSSEMRIRGQRLLCHLFEDACQ